MPKRTHSVEGWRGPFEATVDGTVVIDGKTYDYNTYFDGHPLDQGYGPTYIVIDDHKFRLGVTENGKLRFMDANELMDLLDAHWERTGKPSRGDGYLHFIDPHRIAVKPRADAAEALRLSHLNKSRINNPD